MPHIHTEIFLRENKNFIRIVKLCVPVLETNMLNMKIEHVCVAQNAFKWI